MSTILSGKEVALCLRSELQARAAALRERGIVPTLATVRVGADEADASYARGIRASCTAVGIALQCHALAADAPQSALEDLLQELNADPTVSGVLLFRPLPKHFDEKALCRLLSPHKDVDCMTDASLAGVWLGGDSFLPCTPEACMRVLAHYGIDCTGKHAVVLGRSAVVGRPLAELLLRSNATVTVCHSKTENPAALCRTADILIAAAGKARLVTAEFVKPGAVMLDVGIHWNEAEQRLTGDVDFDAVSPLAGAITPVPGGVGALTPTVLAAHVVAAAERSAV